MSGPNVSEPFTLLYELNRNTTVKQFWEKLRFLRNQKVEITASSLQPGHLWVLTFCWLLFYGAFCVTEGVAKAPVRQREARENTNASWQKSHSTSRWASFSSWEVSEQPLLWGWVVGLWIFFVKKYFFPYFPYFSLSDTPLSMIHLLYEEF